jgi:hypothetical protein
MTRIHDSWYLVWLCACLVCLGCGSDEEERFTVTGKVTDNGQPLQVGSDGILRIEFLRYEGSDESKKVLDAPSSSLDAQGQYSVSVPVGQYAIAVVHHPQYRGPNQLESVFPGVNSPLTRTIEEDQQLDIEIGDFRKGR